MVLPHHPNHRKVSQMEQTPSQIRNGELLEWRIKVINELRYLAQLLEVTELNQFPTPNVYCSVYTKPAPTDTDIYNEPPITPADVRQAMAASPGHWSKLSWDNQISYAKSLGAAIRVSFEVSRSQVCERIQVGTKIEPATPEREVPVYEWRCNEPMPEVDNG